MAGPRDYRTFGERDAQLFRDLIAGSRSPSRPVSPSASPSGIMAPRGVNMEEEARRSAEEAAAIRGGIGITESLTGPLSLEDSIVGQVARSMGANADDPESVATAVTTVNTDIPRANAGIQAYADMRPVEETLALGAGDQTLAALGRPDPLDMPDREGTTQGFTPPAAAIPPVATGPDVVEDMDVDAKAARTRRSWAEQVQPDRGIFAYEGPEAAMSEASIETNLNAEQRRESQSALNNLGFSAGSADGIIGNRTRDAIAQYQVTLGLPPTGFLDERTQNALDTGATGRPLSEVEAEFDFIGGTQGGRALRAAEELRYNAYSLNHQPVLMVYNEQTGQREPTRHRSGITLGVGVDLGQQSAEDMLELGVPREIVEKLEQSGFLGVTPENIVEENDSFRRQGHAALLERYQEQMQNGTLVALTPEEMDTLTEVLYEEKYMPTVEAIYNSTSYSDDVPFDELSEEARAALGAEAWHYTNNLSNNASAFARAASRNDIRGITNLYLYPDRGPRVLNALGVN